MKKKIAFVISGFLRDYSNINEIKKTIDKNNDKYEFYVFVNTYNYVGNYGKSARTDQTKSALLDKSKFNGIEIRHFNLIDYSNLVDDIKIYYDNNFDKIKNIIRSKNNCINFNSKCGRFKMAEIGLKFVKESNIKFDYVIQTRFDLVAKSMSKFEDVNKNHISGSFSKGLVHDLTENTILFNKLGVITDKIFMFCYEDLDKIINAISLDNIFNIINNIKIEDVNKLNFFDKKDNEETNLLNINESILYITLKNKGFSFLNNMNNPQLKDYVRLKTTFDNLS